MAAQADTMANLSQESASEIPDFIMTDGGQCSLGGNLEHGQK